MNQEKQEINELIDSAIGAYFGTKAAKKSAEAISNAPKKISQHFDKQRKKKEAELKKAKEYQQKRAENHRKAVLEKQKERENMMRKDQAERAKRFIKKYRKKKAKK